MYMCKLKCSEEGTYIYIERCRIVDVCVKVGSDGDSGECFGIFE